MVVMVLPDVGALKVHQLARPQTMTVSQGHHEPVAQALTVLPGSRRQGFNLRLSEVFPRPAVFLVRPATVGAFAPPKKRTTNNPPALFHHPVYRSQT